MFILLHSVPSQPGSCDWKDEAEMMPEASRAVHTCRAEEGIGVSFLHHIRQPYQSCKAESDVIGFRLIKKIVFAV